MMKVLKEKINLPIIRLLGLCLVILFITMPKYRYEGDPDTIRFSAKNLLENAQFSFTNTEKEKLPPGLFITFGGNFYYNYASERYYSKWGWFNTLLLTQPLILKNITDVFSMEFSEIFCSNIINIFYSLIFIYILLKLTSLFSSDLKVNHFYILFTVFGSFCWNYLRAQTTEIYILLFFHLFLYYFLKHQRTSKNRDMFLFSINLLFLILTKNVFVLLIPILFIFLQPWKKFSKRQWIFYLSLNMMSASVILFSNYIQFNNPLETGYGQQGLSVPNFTMEFYHGLLGFILKPNRSIFLHIPLFVFALIGANKFMKKFPFEYNFLVSIFLSFLIFFSFLNNWEGEWSYGPRLMLFILPSISLMSLPVLTKLFSGWRRYAVYAFFVGAFFVQVIVNSFSFFSSHNLRYSFKSIYNDSEIEKYFDNRHLGIVHYDLWQNYQGKKDFLPLMKIKETQGENDYNYWKNKTLKTKKINFYFFPEGNN